MYLYVSLQMSKDVLVQAVPMLVNLLRAESPVVHSYAACAIEKIFTVKTPEGKPA